MIGWQGKTNVSNPNGIISNPNGIPWESLGNTIEVISIINSVGGIPKDTTDNNKSETKSTVEPSCDLFI